MVALFTFIALVFHKYSQAETRHTVGARLVGRLLIAQQAALLQGFRIPADKLNGDMGLFIPVLPQR